MEDNNSVDNVKTSEIQAGNEYTQCSEAQTTAGYAQASETQIGTEYAQTVEAQQGMDYSNSAEYQQTGAYSQAGYQNGVENAQAAGYQTGEYAYDQYGNPIAYGYGYVNQERNLYGEEEKDIIMAVLSLVFGIIGIVTSAVFIGLSFDIAAIVLGIVVLKRRYYGKKLAIAGLITSGIGVLLSIAMIVFLSIAASDLTGELISTLVDYFYYYSEGGLEDNYYFDDEYTDEYSEDEYIDDAITDEGYMDEGIEEEVIEEEPVEEISVDQIIRDSRAKSVSEEAIYSGVEDQLPEETEEIIPEEEYFDESEDMSEDVDLFIENM